jgi:CheY-like chemotaxis protein
MARAQVFIVEDDRITAEDIRLSLGDLGYSVLAIASSGEEAIKKAEELHPDLVLMDIVLRGDMDGIEAAERIRARFDIQVVYLTAAYMGGKTLERARITEPFRYVSKPFEGNELGSAIGMALSKHKLEREPGE